MSFILCDSSAQNLKTFHIIVPREMDVLSAILAHADAGIRTDLGCPPRPLSPRRVEAFGQLYTSMPLYKFDRTALSMSVVLQISDSKLIQILDAKYVYEYTRDNNEPNWAIECRKRFLKCYCTSRYFSQVLNEYDEAFDIRDMRRTYPDEYSRYFAKAAFGKP